jgi:hypothetical protein
MGDGEDEDVVEMKLEGDQIGETAQGCAADGGHERRHGGPLREGLLAARDPVEYIG